MRRIALRNIARKVIAFALVDDEDYEELNKVRWCTVGDVSRGTKYAWRNDRSGGKHTAIRMHRVIMKPPAGMVVDHINGNGLDNRRANLRICTPLENFRNRPKLSKNNTSGASCVYWQKDCRKWKASVGMHKKHHYLGLFETKAKAKEAVLNFKRTHYV